MAKQLKTQFENNRQMILKTASRLFTEKGIGSTSFTDIAREVKLSKGTIYYYYPSKDHLIYETTEYHFKQVTDSIFSWISHSEPGMPLDKALLSLTGSLFKTTAACKLHICLVYEGIMGNEAVKKRFYEKYNEWATMVEVGLVKTGTGPEDIKRISRAVFQVLDGAILKRSLGIAPEDIDETGVFLIRKLV